MDILLGKFVEKNIAKLDEQDLINLNEIMSLDDELLHQWYFNNINNNKIFNSKISQKLKKFILYPFTLLKYSFDYSPIEL